jgi:hypothetical protein
MVGTAEAMPYLESTKVRDGLHEIELDVSNATSMATGDYVLEERDDPSRRVIASRVEQTSTSIAFVIQAGDPMLPGLLDRLALDRFPGAVSQGMVIEYGDSVRVIGAGRLSELHDARLHPGKPARGNVLDAIERAIDELEQTPSDRRAIIDRRAFSWTGLFASLEEALPPGVRLVSVSPRDAPGGMELSLAAVGRDVGDALALLRALQEHPDFDSAFLNGWNEGREGVDISSTVRYVPGASARRPR